MTTTTSFENASASAMAEIFYAHLDKQPASTWLLSGDSLMIIKEEMSNEVLDVFEKNHGHDDYSQLSTDEDMVILAGILDEKPTSEWVKRFTDLYSPLYEDNCNAVYAAFDTAVEEFLKGQASEVIHSVFSATPAPGRDQVDAAVNQMITDCDFWPKNKEQELMNSAPTEDRVVWLMHCMLDIEPLLSFSEIKQAYSDIKDKVAAGLAGKVVANQHTFETHK